VKGVQATTTSESQERQKTDSNGYLFSNKQLNDSSNDGKPLLRRRSSSIGLSMDDEVPVPMQILGSTNDCGLGLLSWW
jgi:hypothetical protein